jgi:hypothetical protein
MQDELGLTVSGMSTKQRLSPCLFQMQLMTQSGPNSRCSTPAMAPSPTRGLYHPASVYNNEYSQSHVLWSWLRRGTSRRSTDSHITVRTTVCV